MTQHNLEGKPLTKREIQIMQLICMQHTTDEIAEQLGTGVRVVEEHRKNLLAKTGSRNKIGVLLYAIRNGYFKV